MTEPLTLTELRKAIDTIRYGRAFDRCPPHVVAPGLDLVLADPLPTDEIHGCANLCGATFVMRRRQESSS